MTNDGLLRDSDEEDTLPLPDEALPLDGWHRARGARMVSFAGYAMPIQYEGIIAEHLWTRAHASLFDVSHMGQLRLSGPGVAAALEALVPGDMAALKPGAMRYSLLLSEEGGILDDLMVTGAADHFYCVVNGATKWDDLAHLREYLDDAITLSLMDEHALLALQGPEAAGALAALVPGVDALFFMQAGAFSWQGVDLHISRSGYTGEDGFEISLPADAAEAFADALCARPEVRSAGLGARDSLRLEAGLPLYGHDLDEDTSPVEAGLAFAISKRRRVEGGFAGAERILAELHAGPARKRVGLAAEGRQPVREGAPLFIGPDQVGVVTSGGFSPSLEAPIAMGYVASAHAALGTALEAEVRGRRIPLAIVPMPFVPHQYRRKGA